MEQRRYGEWVGNPQGHPEQIGKCIETVHPGTKRFEGYVGRQCNRKRGHGPDGLYCKQHGKRAEERLGA